MTLPAAPDCSLPASFDNWTPAQAAIPDLCFRKERWSKVRLNKVDDIAREFDKTPNLAIVLEDKKLKGKSLVLVQKKVLEALLNLSDDLKAGQAGLKLDCEELQLHITLLEQLMKTGQSEENPITLAFRAFKMSCSRLTSKFFVFSSGQAHAPRALTEEEESQLLPGDEEDDDCPTAQARAA